MITTIDIYEKTSQTRRNERQCLWRHLGGLRRVLEPGGGFAGQQQPAQVRRGVVEHRALVAKVKLVAGPSVEQQLPANLQALLKQHVHVYLNGASK